MPLLPPFHYYAFLSFAFAISSFIRCFSLAAISLGFSIIRADISFSSFSFFRFSPHFHYFR
jgi:hypothetical protein